MIVKLFDKTEFYCTSEQAEKIKVAIAEGQPSIEIEGRWMRVSAIATIMPGGFTEVDRITDSARLLDRPDFRGRYSPAKEKLRSRFAERTPIS